MQVCGLNIFKPLSLLPSTLLVLVWLGAVPDKPIDLQKASIGPLMFHTVRG